MNEEQRGERLRLMEAEPQGVEIGPIALLHRHEDGFIAFMRTDPATGKPTPFASVTAAELRSQPFLPTLVQNCSIDGFVSMNAFYRQGTRKTSDLRYLNAAYVDLDFYQKDATGKIVRSIGWYDAIGMMLRLGDEGVIPPPSIYVRSGNGAWLLWLLHDEETGRSPEAWPDNREWLKRIQEAARERIRAAAASLQPDENAPDLSRVLRVPGSFSTKAARQVAWIPIPDAKTGEVISYTLTEIGDAFGEVKRPAIPQRNLRERREPIPDERRVPRRNAGRRAVTEQRLRDLYSLSAHREGFAEGCRNSALFLLACLMAKLGVTPEQIREQLEREAARCRPPLPDAEAAEIFLSATKGKYPRWTNATLVAKLGVTPEEAAALDAEGTPLRQIRPGFVPKGEQKRLRGAERRSVRLERRALVQSFTVMALDAKGKVPPLRDLVRWLDALGVTASHETIRGDLKSLRLHPSEIPDRQRLILETAAEKGEPN